MQDTPSETAISTLTSNKKSCQNEATTKKSLMFEHRRSVLHSKDGGRVECPDVNYKTNQPSQLFLVDHIDYKFSEMFHSLLSLNINKGFGYVFELNNVEHQHLGILLFWFAAVLSPRNQVASLDKSISYLQFIHKLFGSMHVPVVYDYTCDCFCCYWQK